MSIQITPEGIAFVAVLILGTAAVRYTRRKEKEGKLEDARDAWINASVATGKWLQSHPFADQTHREYQELIARELEAFEGYLDQKNWRTDEEWRELTRLRSLKSGFPAKMSQG